MSEEMFEKTIGNETEQLMYLKISEYMGLHIVDFMDAASEQLFAEKYLFYYFKPVFHDIMRSSSDLRSWGPLMAEAVKIDYKTINAELSLVLRQAEELDDESNIETVCMYIGSNEYIFYCYERLVKYVKRFYGV